MTMQPTYKATIRQSINLIEAIKRQRPLQPAEAEELERLYYELDTNQDYLNESGQAYENQ